MLPEDVARCPGEGCPIRDTCLRYLEPPAGEWQVWIQPDPENCEEYLEKKDAVD